MHAELSAAGAVVVTAYGSDHPLAALSGWACSMQTHPLEPGQRGTPRCGAHSPVIRWPVHPDPSRTPAETGPDWIHQPKLDGWRVQIAKERRPPGPATCGPPATHVHPPLEIIVTEGPPHLCTAKDKESGLALIRL